MTRSNSNTRRAAINQTATVSNPQHIVSVHLVVQRVEAKFGRSLRFSVFLVIQIGERNLPNKSIKSPSSRIVRLATVGSQTSLHRIILPVDPRQCTHVVPGSAPLLIALHTTSAAFVTYSS